MATLFGIFCVLLSTGSTLAKPAPPNATFGFLWQLSSLGGPFQVQIDSGELIVQAACDAVNADPSLLPNTTLHMVSHDTVSLTNLIPSMRATKDMILNDDPVALIGSLFSENTTPNQLYASVWGIPTIGPSSTTYSQTRLGGLFIRTIIHGGSIASAMWFFAREMGWSNMIAVHTDHVFAQEWAEALASTSLSVKIFLLEDDMGTVLDDILDTNRRIIAYSLAQQNAPFFTLAQERGMLDGDYAWLGAIGSGPEELAIGDIYGYPRDIWLGQISFGIPEIQGARWDAAWAELTSRMPEITLHSRVVPLYDAVLTLAHGLHSLYNSDDENNGTNLYSHMLELEFDGIAWPLAFETTEESSGDAFIPITLWNYKTDDEAPLGGDFVPVVVADMRTEVFTIVDTLVWPGGEAFNSGAFIPSDLAPSLECPTNPSVCSRYPTGAVVTDFYLAEDVNGSYVCNECSGLGSCSLLTGLCSCRQPSIGPFVGLEVVTGDDCSIISEEYVIGASFKGAIITLAVIVLAVCAVVSGALVYFKNKPIIKASAPTFGLIGAFGGILLVAHSLPLFFETTVASCYTRAALLQLGFTLLWSPFLIKTFRIKVLFDTRKLKVKLFPNSKCYAYIAALVAIDVILLVTSVLTTTTEVQPRALLSTNETVHGAYYFQCVTDNNSLKIVALLKTILLLMWGISLAFATRKIPYKIMREAKSISLVIYNTGFSALFFSPLLVIEETLEPGLFETLQQALIAYTVISTLAIFYIPKFTQLDASITNTDIKSSTQMSGRKRPSKPYEHSALRHHHDDV